MLAIVSLRTPDSGEVMFNQQLHNEVSLLIRERGMRVSDRVRRVHLGVGSDRGGSVSAFSERGRISIDEVRGPDSMRGVPAPLGRDVRGAEADVVLDIMAEEKNVLEDEADARSQRRQ